MRQEPLGGQRQHEEALQAEGHRARAPRLDPRPHLRRRRQGPPAAPAGLELPAAAPGARAALKTALSKFAKEGRLLVVDSFELAEIKTKELLDTLDTLKAEQKTLVVDSQDNEKLRLSIRNCKEHQFLPPEGVNVYDLLRHDTLILSKDAAKALEARCLKQSAPRSARVQRRRASMTPEQIIRRPIILTEKSNLLRETAQPGRLRGRAHGEQDPDQGAPSRSSSR